MCNIFANQNPERYESQTRRLRLNGQSTSIRLENSFWEIVDELAEIEGVSSPVFISKLHSEVLELHGEVPNFTSLLRCACLIHMDKTALSLDANSEEQSSALFVLASESDRVTL
ncbi:MAG: DNA-binding protein [Hyphomicrobiales bacterium]|nr:MAG: DNA-binding protein [Hyphomicrobiales bacterium]